MQTGNLLNIDYNLITLLFSLLAGAVASFLYLYYHVKSSTVQYYGQYWYFYPANEVWIPCILIQFSCTMGLLLIDRWNITNFYWFAQKIFVPSFFIHIYLCYHKDNSFTPSTIRQFTNRINSYRYWKIILLYVIPLALFSGAFMNLLPMKSLTHFLIVPFTLLALLICMPFVHFLYTQHAFIWILDALPPSTRLLMEETCYPIYITVNLFSRRYQVKKGTPSFSLWNKVVFFKLFNNSAESDLLQDRLLKLDRIQINKIISQQNPTWEDRTQWLHKD